MRGTGSLVGLVCSLWKSDCVSGTLSGWQHLLRCLSAEMGHSQLCGTGGESELSGDEGKRERTSEQGGPTLAALTLHPTEICKH